jgi:hypothetical protein
MLFCEWQLTKQVVTTLVNSGMEILCGVLCPQIGESHLEQHLREMMSSSSLTLIVYFVLVHASTTTILFFLHLFPSQLMQILFPACYFLHDLSQHPPHYPCFLILLPSISYSHLVLSFLPHNSLSGFFSLKSPPSVDDTAFSVQENQHRAAECHSQLHGNMGFTYQSPNRVMHRCLT